MKCLVPSTPALRVRAAVAVPPVAGAATVFATAAGEVDYAVAGRWWVACAPRAPATERLQVARACIAAAAAAGRRVAWFGLDERLARALGGARLRIGVEAWWHASRWAATVRGVASLRAQLHRARNHGVRIRAIDPAAASVVDRERAAVLVRAWQAHHRLPPMQFLLRVEPFRSGPQRRVLFAECNGQLVGLAGAVLVGGRATVVTELLRSPQAPNGTAELLFDALVRLAAAAGHGRLTLGLLPLHGEVPWSLRVVRWWFGRRYDCRGLGRWKAKLRPQRWRSQWLVLPPGATVVGGLMAVGRAFAGQPLRRYAMRCAGWVLRQAWPLARRGPQAPSLAP